MAPVAALGRRRPRARRLVRTRGRTSGCLATRRGRRRPSHAGCGRRTAGAGACWRRCHAQRPDGELRERSRLERVRKSERISARRHHLSGSRGRRSAPRRCDAPRTRARVPTRGRATGRRRSRVATAPSLASARKAATSARGSASRSGRASGAGLDPERSGERVALRLGQLVGDVVESGIEQVRDRSQRDRHLCLGAPRDEHADALALSGRSTPRARGRSCRCRARRG